MTEQSGHALLQNGEAIAAGQAIAKLIQLSGDLKLALLLGTFGIELFLHVLLLFQQGARVIGYVAGLKSTAPFQFAQLLRLLGASPRAIRFANISSTSFGSQAR